MKRLILFLIVLVTMSYTQVKWSLDGVRMSVAQGIQQNAVCVSDMDYGTIVVWEDDRSGPYDLYAQRVDSSGTLLWSPGGVPVCVGFGYKEAIAMCSDEAGGAIVAWQDYRHATGPDIYAQRIDNNGNCLWQAEGVPVCTASNTQQMHVAVSDGNHGTIIIWSDERHTPDGHPLYAQWIDSGGTTRWQINGVAVCTTATAYSRYPEAIPDGVGGAYIVYQDHIFSQYIEDIYFQHIDSLGNHLLPWTGVCIVGEEHLQSSPKITQSLDNTLIVAWRDSRNVTVTKSDIYSIRIDTLGNPLWDSTGVPVCTADSVQDCAFTNLIPSAYGSAIAHWMDWRNGNYDIYAQRIDINGNQVWAENGVPVCTLSAVPHWIRRGVSDDSSGAVYKWGDARNGIYEEFFQRISADGESRWEANGVRACTVSAGDREGLGICTDGKGGAISVWTDSRYGSFDLDIWAQRVNDGHGPGIKETESEIYISDLSLEVYPNPFCKKTEIRYTMQDTGYKIKDFSLKIFDASGRLIKDFSHLTLDAQRPTLLSWDGKDNDGKQLAQGIYFIKLKVEGTSYTKKVILLK